MSGARKSHGVLSNDDTSRRRREQVSFEDIKRLDTSRANTAATAGPVARGRTHEVAQLQGQDGSTSTTESSGSRHRTTKRRGSSMFRSQRRMLASKLWGMTDKEFGARRVRHNMVWSGARGCARLPLIHPESAFRVRWDLVAILLVLYTSVFVPYRVAFMPFAINFWFFFDVAQDLFFAADIVLNFHTGIMRQGAVVMNSSLIVRRYLHGFFVLDLVATIPIDYISFAFGTDETQLLTASRALRVLRLARLLRLLRLARLFRYMGRFVEALNSSHVRIMKLFFLLLLFAHWNACLIYLVATLDSLERSWVADNHLLDADNSERYSIALFNSLSHMLCIGYGRTAPGLLSEVWVTIWSMLAGASCYAGIIGSISAMMLNMDASGSRYLSRLDEMTQYMRDNDLPAALRDRVRGYFEQRWQQRKMFSEEELLALLPTSMEKEIRMYNCASVLAKVPLLQDVDKGFLSAVVMALRKMLVPQFEVLILEREAPAALFFINQGVVGLYRRLTRVTTLAEGSYFGDIALLWGRKQPFSVRTEEVTELFWLSELDFHSIMIEYPDMVVIMKTIARQRLKHFRIPEVDEDVATMAETHELHRLQSFFQRAASKLESAGHSLETSVRRRQARSRISSTRRAADPTDYVEGHEDAQGAEPAAPATRPQHRALSPVNAANSAQRSVPEAPDSAGSRRQHAERGRGGTGDGGGDSDRHGPGMEEGLAGGQHGSQPLPAADAAIAAEVVRQVALLLRQQTLPADDDDAGDHTSLPPGRRSLLRPPSATTGSQPQSQAGDPNAGVASARGRSVSAFAAPTGGHLDMSGSTYAAQNAYRGSFLRRASQLRTGGGLHGARSPSFSGGADAGGGVRSPLAAAGPWRSFTGPAPQQATMSRHGPGHPSGHSLHSHDARDAAVVDDARNLFGASPPRQRPLSRHPAAPASSPPPSIAEVAPSGGGTSPRRTPLHAGDSVNGGGARVLAAMPEAQSNAVTHPSAAGAAGGGAPAGESQSQDATVSATV